jgi:hypothetical protein
MSVDNSMDVDDAPKLLPPFIPSSSLRLSQAEVNAFMTQMIAESKSEVWLDRITNAGSDEEKLRNVLYSVLKTCWNIVPSHQALQKIFITFSDIAAIKAHVQSLNAGEVEEWKNLVEKGDWVGLFSHRMCLVRFRRRYVVMRYWHSETSETSRRCHCQSTRSDVASFVFPSLSFCTYAHF